MEAEPTVHNLGPLASQTLREVGVADHVEQFPIPAWHDQQAGPGAIVVIYATWPSDARGRALLEDYAAKGWEVRLADDPTL